ncbi:hypothetical protein CUMW_269680 [Citrus unshiu]|uniref:Uncharacterized protein n=1 Tax=Citrus unshiu TaxID=55188 RepID=A0A2H5QWZ9_CITUN|nr:hypothetical protein CUMW_269680 [Citrus unshiu]
MRIFESIRIVTNTPSDFKFVYGGYKGVVAVDQLHQQSYHEQRVCSRTRSKAQVTFANSKYQEKGASPRINHVLKEGRESRGCEPPTLRCHVKPKLSRSAEALELALEHSNPAKTSETREGNGKPDQDRFYQCATEHSSTRNAIRSGEPDKEYLFTMD